MFNNLKSAHVKCHPMLFVQTNTNFGLWAPYKQQMLFYRVQSACQRDYFCSQVQLGRSTLLNKTVSSISSLKTILLGTQHSKALYTMIFISINKYKLEYRAGWHVCMCSVNMGTMPWALR